MADKINREMIDYVSNLSKLSLSENEKEMACGDLEKLLKYIDIMNEVDTTCVEPLWHLNGNCNVMREDEVKEYDGSGIIKSAPLIKNDYYVVPRSVEG